MSNLITVRLKDPVTLPSNEVLHTVTLKKATTGNVAAARAAIARHKNFGREMVDDTLTLALFLLPSMTVSSDVAVLPPSWPMLTSEDDAEILVKTYGALRNGFASVEDFEADARAKQAAREAAAEAGEKAPVFKEDEFPGGAATPEG